MIATAKDVLTVETTIHAPVEEVWECWSNPKHIVRWNYASDDWHTPRSENNLHEGGKFLSRMEARDGSWGFDFSGVYTKVEPYKLISYLIDDGREVQVTFMTDNNNTIVTENFEPEDTHSFDMQKMGWQAILDNFRRYVEISRRMVPLHFEIQINAPADKVFHILTNKETWMEWVSVFNPSSRFEGSWDRDSEIRFLGEDEHGNLGGMVCRIRENIPGKYLSIEYTGVVDNNKVVTSGPEAEKWAGGRENYTLSEENGKTTLAVDSDAVPEFREYFENTWPQALNKLKEICERVKKS